MQILTDSAKFVRAGNSDWQQQMKLAVRRPEQLLSLLELPENTRICDAQSSGPFPLFVPLPFLSRMQKGNPSDPLLRQVLPIPDESDEVAGFSADPLQESEYVLQPGLLKKYNQRALLIVNGSCAVHCRYCFRRHFPYSDSIQNDQRLRDSMEQLAADSSIEEVILSGGDPLTMVDARLEQMLEQIQQIDHVTRLRIHTRLPIVIPQRVTQAFLGMLENSRLDTIVVVHCNHGNELDSEVQAACRALGQVCNGLLNQSVLLRGVNDSVEDLSELSEKLVRCGVTPYYLHQLDDVSGAAHFHVPVERGVELIRLLRESTSGYMVPRYVKEIPGQPNKTVLA